MQLLSDPPTLMWEHQGRCPCGRRCYLFGQCSKCLREEQRGLKEVADQVVEDTEAVHDLLEDENVQGALLPGTLPTPIRKTGMVTQFVHFITDRLLKGILQEAALLKPKGHGTFKELDSWKGESVLKPWLHGESFELPLGSQADSRFRISSVSYTHLTLPTTPYV